MSFASTSNLCDTLPPPKLALRPTPTPESGEETPHMSPIIDHQRPNHNQSGVRLGRVQGQVEQRNHLVQIVQKLVKDSELPTELHSLFFLQICSLLSCARRDPPLIRLLAPVPSTRLSRPCPGSPNLPLPTPVPTAPFSLAPSSDVSLINSGTMKLFELAAPGWTDQDDHIYRSQSAQSHTRSASVH
jgi:hypothetical protein